MKATQKEKNFTERPWYHDLGLCSPDIRKINRLISNHSYDKRWLHRFGKENDELCDECLIPDTAEHQVFRCFKYRAIRLSYSLISTTTSSQEMMNSDKRLDIITEVLKFIKECKLEF